MGFKTPGYLGYREAFIYLMVVSLIAVCLPARVTERFDHAMAKILGPFYLRSRQSGLAISEQLRTNDSDQISPREWRMLIEETKRYQMENSNLRQELINQKQLVERLAGLRQSLRMERMSFVAASVMGSTGNAASRIYLLDHGTASQVRPGLYAVGGSDWEKDGEQTSDKPDIGVSDESVAGYYDHAVVGRIVSSGAQTSNLQLITDPAFRVPVIIEPSPERGENWQAEGMLIGQGMQPIIITMVSSNYPVQPNDPVFIRSAPDTLPIPVVTGKVQSAQRDEKNPVMLNITVRPMIELERLNEVVVVTPVHEAHTEEIR